MARVTLIVEVDLAPEGELSTVHHWREMLQRQLNDFAGTFRPYVRGQVKQCSETSSRPTGE